MKRAIGGELARGRWTASRQRPTAWMHDDRDVGGRVTQGAVTEEVEHQKWALQATQGAVADDCMDAGDRATQGAIAE
jgi:hypothetical protein